MRVWISQGFGRPDSEKIGTDYMETIEQQAKLTEKHKMIIKQQTTPAKDLGES